MDQVVGRLGWSADPAVVPDQVRSAREQRLASLAGRSRLRIPERFEGVTFGNYEPLTPSEEAAKRRAERWVEEVRTGDEPLLAFTGSPGTGKTHLLWAAMRQVACFRKQVLVLAWYTVAQQLRTASWEKQDDWWRSTTRDPETCALVLGLNEVRRTTNTDWDGPQVANLVLWAYDTGVPLFLTTNIHPIADQIGDPAASRLEQVIVTGPDYRERQRRAP